MRQTGKMIEIKISIKRNKLNIDGVKANENCIYIKIEKTNRTLND